MRVFFVQLAALFGATVLGALLCVVGFMGSIILSLSTGRAFSIPGLTQTTVGSGSELTSTQIQPTAIYFFVGLSLAFYLAALLFQRSRRRSSAGLRR